MTVRTLYVILIGFFFSTPLFSQIRGRVIELNQNGDTASVPGVILLWSHSSINTTTNENGLFSIKKTADSNVLLIKATSYKSDSVAFSVPAS